MRILLTTLLILGAAGCSKVAPPPADPDLGKALLEEILTAWKEGKDMNAQNATFFDPDHYEGRKLVKFTIDGTPAQFGHDLRVPVTVWMDEEDEPRKVFFTMALSPRKVVRRDMMNGAD
jgi:hypothetical protein